jgi:hypothetical protein
VTAFTSGSGRTHPAASNGRDNVRLAIKYRQTIAVDGKNDRFKL